MTRLSDPYQSSSAAAASNPGADLSLPTPTPAVPAPPAGVQPPTPADGTKERREVWQFYVDTGVKFFQILALVASGLWAVEQFQDQHDKDREIRKKEFKEAQDKRDEDRKQREHALRLKFYEEQRPLYLKVCEVAAAIAAAERFADVKETVQTFRQLFLGQLNLAVDQQVQPALLDFSQALDREMGEGEAPSNDLRNKAVLLSRACRSSLDLNKVFNVELPLDAWPGIDNLKNPYPF
jgi:hypothetical protein